MRDAACQGLVSLSKQSPFVFMTGDLGFKALEPLKEALGPRFINAGVAEQNMVSAAAGLAGSGMQVWLYSIAPFLYARPFEQLRNDICLHSMDVKLVGNGGGYGYGSMGSSHHAIEDYGVLLALQKMTVLIPAFATDVASAMQRAAALKGPVYLRLGKDERPPGLEAPDFEPWRLLLPGSKGLLLALGPLAGGLAERLQAMPPQSRPELWCLGQLPSVPPDAFLNRLSALGKLWVVEEHVLQGSAGQALAHWLLAHGRVPPAFGHVYAKGYLSKSYGSQAFHRKECGLDPESVLNAIVKG